MFLDGPGLLKPFGNPAFDIAPLVPEIPANPKTRWAFVSVSPCVDGGCRYPEVGGKVLHGEQWVTRCHGPILCPNPLIRVSFRCNWACHQLLRSVLGATSIGHLADWVTPQNPHASFVVGCPAASGRRVYERVSGTLVRGLGCLVRDCGVRNHYPPAPLGEKPAWFCPASGVA